jgi:CRP-like cAMP-binding protein
MPRSDLLSDRVPAAENHLIAALPSKDRARLLASGEEVKLVFGKTLVEPGGRIRHVYFPTDGSYISLLTPVDGASGLEVGLVGNEGLCGVSVLLGSDLSPLRALVQGSGSALRLGAAAFKREARDSPALQRQLNRYLYVLMTQLAQSAACTRFHLIEARLARWLLMTHDRAHSGQFHITHAFLAWMLGVRRASVTEAANALQARRLITYQRGHITVLDRSALEGTACACYRADQKVYRTMLGAPPHMTGS